MNASTFPRRSAHLLARAAVAGSLTFVLAACGGGGGGGGDANPVPVVTPTTATFPFAQAYNAHVLRGSTTNYAVTGTCSGTATHTSSPAVNGTLYGSAVLVVNETLTVNYSNCTPSTNTSTSQVYYQTDFRPLATGSNGEVTGRFLTPPTPLPATVKAGDSGMFGTETLYGDSTLSTVTGKINLSYVIEAQTTTTSVATLITQGYDAANQLVVTQRTKFRLGTDASFSEQSIDVQYSGGSSTFLVFTKV